MMQDTERVARTLAPHLEGGREFDQMPPDRRTLKIWRANGMCSTNDATQEDAIDAATAALSAMTPDTDYVRGWNDAVKAAAELQSLEDIAVWNAAIQVVAALVDGCMYNAHGRPQPALSEAIRQLKKPTGNLAPTPADSV
jgi:hypothetical protein